MSPCPTSRPVESEAGPAERVKNSWPVESGGAKGKEGKKNTPGVSDEPILQWNDAWCVEIQARPVESSGGKQGACKKRRREQRWETGGLQKAAAPKERRKKTRRPIKISSLTR